MLSADLTPLLGRARFALSVIADPLAGDMAKTVTAENPAQAGQALLP